MAKLKHEMPGLPSSLYRPLSDSDLPRITGEAMRVLEKSGIAVYSPTAREVLRKAGAEVDEESMTARLPKSMVEDAVASNPSSITLYSRDGKTDIHLEKNRVHYGTGGTAIYVLDPDTGKRRPSTTEDVILNARLVDELEHVHLFTINVFPNEIKENDAIDPNRFFHALDNTNKHVMGGVYSMEGCRRALEMAALVAGGEKKLVERPFISFITLVISPFKIDRYYGDITCYLAEKKIPVVVPTEPICGTTSPITLAGNVLTHLAETLAGIVLVQSARRGAPGIGGSVGSTSNLRNMNHVGGSIERAMLNAAASQLAQYLEIPFYSTAGTSDAKEMDIQAAWESAMSSLLVAMSGANYIHDIAGLMEADLTVSYEKLIVDNEILGMCQRVLRGIEVTDETLSTDLMIEKGPAGDYLGEENTVRFMRSEFFEPKLANRDKRDAMKPDDDALARARKYLADFRARPAESRLEKGTREKILALFPEIKDG